MLLAVLTRDTVVIHNKLLLVGLLSGLFIITMVTERLLPQFSGAALIYFFIISYTGLQSLAQAHHKRFERKRQMMDMDKTETAALIRQDYQPSIAVLVPCHNESAVIAETVERLMQLTYPDFTLWVIDDRSTDDTAALLTRLSHKYDKRFHWFTRSPESKPGKSAVLNDARSRISHAKVFAVFDADARVAPDFLDQLVPFLADYRVGAVQARKVMFNAHYNLLTRCQKYEYCMDAHFQSGRDVVHGAVELRGNGQLIKARALDEVGGWNEATITDDLDLSTQLHLAGWDVRFARKVVVAEEAIPRFWPLLLQRRRWAEGSLVRYLTYAIHMVTSPHISLRATIDMVAWFTQFLMPFWLLIDYLLLLDALRLGDADKLHLVSSLLLLPLLSAFFTSSLLIGIRRFESLTWFQAFQWSCITGTYMTFVWVPVVFWVVLRILFRNAKTLDWGKTIHGTCDTSPASVPLQGVL